MASVRLIVVGAGSRGAIYADYAGHYPEAVKIVGVAEPREHYREKLAREHGIPLAYVVADWRELLSRTKFADGVVRS